jgi:hypothetical protein
MAFLPVQASDYKEPGPIASYLYTNGNSTVALMTQKPRYSYSTYLIAMRLEGPIAQQIYTKAEDALFSGNKSYGRITLDRQTQVLTLTTYSHFERRRFASSQLICSPGACELRVFEPEMVTRSAGQTYSKRVVDSFYSKNFSAISFDDENLENLFGDANICESHFLSGGPYGSNSVCYMELGSQD